MVIEAGGEGSFQAVKLRRPARATVCSHSARDLATVHPSNQCLMIGIFSTSVCAVVNSCRYKSREQKHSESQSTLRILSRRISPSLPRPDFAIHTLNSVSFLVSKGPTKTPSAACGHCRRFVERSGLHGHPEQHSHSQRGGQGFEPPPVHQSLVKLHPQTAAS